MSSSIVVGGYALEIIKCKSEELWGFMKESGLQKRAKNEGVEFRALGHDSIPAKRQAEQTYWLLTGKHVAFGDNEFLCIFIRSSEKPTKDPRPLEVFVGELAKHFHPEVVEEEIP